jgi:hypothetical protein
MTPSREALADLRKKYEELLRLRLEDAAAAGADSRRDPSPEMAAVAERFPGALREIDELSLDSIQTRIAELGVAESDPARARPWMIATHLFHTLARGALTAKRWLGRRKHVDEELVLAFARAAASLPFAEEAALWKDDLHEIARPPRGRVTELVYARIAIEMRIPASEVKLLVFGPGRHGSRRPPARAKRQ